MTKNEMYRALSCSGDTELSYLANVIFTGHTQAGAKLKGVYALYKAGHEVRTAQFDMFTLLIDGHSTSWNTLVAYGKKGADIDAILGQATAIA